MHIYPSPVASTSTSTSSEVIIDTFARNSESDLDEPEWIMDTVPRSEPQLSALAIAIKVIVSMEPMAQNG